MKKSKQYDNSTCQLNMEYWKQRLVSTGITIITKHVSMSRSVYIEFPTASCQF